MTAHCEDERWLPVVGWEGSYEVSDLGRVRSVDRLIKHSYGGYRHLRSRIIRQRPGLKNSAHLKVSLSRQGVNHHRWVHRLVLESFVGPCPDGMEGCHENGDPTDTRLTNLRWDTRSANSRDAVRHGTNWQTKKTHCAQGHEFSPENTIWITEPGRRTWRRCKTCKRSNYRKGAA